MAVAVGTKHRPAFARRLRAARERLGISQIELGRRVGLDEAVVSPRINQYEQGAHMPHLATAERLASVLEVPLSYLYEPDDHLARWILVWSRMPTAEARRRLIEIDAEYPPE